MGTFTDVLIKAVGGPHASMKLYILLVFDGDSEIVATQSIHALDIAHVRRLAESVVAGFTEVAGYHLWHQGRKVLSTLDDEHQPPELALAITIALSRRSP